MGQRARVPKGLTTAIATCRQKPADNASPGENRGWFRHGDGFDGTARGRVNLSVRPGGRGIALQVHEGCGVRLLREHDEAGAGGAAQERLGRRCRFDEVRTQRSGRRTRLPGEVRRVDDALARARHGRAEAADRAVTHDVSIGRRSQAGQVGALWRGVELERHAVGVQSTVVDRHLIRISVQAFGVAGSLKHLGTDVARNGRTEVLIRGIDRRSVHDRLE